MQHINLQFNKIIMRAVLVITLTVSLDCWSASKTVYEVKSHHFSYIEENINYFSSFSYTVNKLENNGFKISMTGYKNELLKGSKINNMFRAGWSIGVLNKAATAIDSFNSSSYEEGNGLRMSSRSFFKQILPFIKYKIKTENHKLLRDEYKTEAWKIESQTLSFEHKFSGQAKIWLMSPVEGILLDLRVANKDAEQELIKQFHSSSYNLEKLITTIKKNKIKNTHLHFFKIRPVTINEPLLNKKKNQTANR